MQLKTCRLDVVALDEYQLSMLLDDMPMLEKRLDCSYKAEPLTGHFEKIVRSQLEIVRSDRDNYLWHSFWLLIDRASRTVVGSADFKACPDKLGRVEIGYGLGEEYEHKGYMSEAVAAMCSWALSQPQVKNVVAETEKSNLPSQRLLRRCGFTPLSEGDTLWWIL